MDVLVSPQGYDSEEFYLSEVSSRKYDHDSNIVFLHNLEIMF